MIYPLARFTWISFALLWVKNIKGTGNLKKEKAYIVAANHSSFYDDILIPGIVIITVDKYVHMYVNSSYFKNYFLRKFLEWARSIPVDVKKKPGSSERNEKAFEEAVRVLREGGLVGIFPEGHRSIDGNLQKAKTGIARLALKARVPVVPMGVKGSYEILPKGSIFMRFKRCRVNIGEPMFFDEYYGKENNKKVLIEVTEKIMVEIARLSGLEYK